jgi:hypothetical protein
MPYQKDYVLIPAGRDILEGAGHFPCRPDTGIPYADRGVTRTSCGIDPVFRMAYDNLRKNLAADWGYFELFCLKTGSQGI